MSLSGDCIITYQLWCKHIVPQQCSFSCHTNWKPEWLRSSIYFTSVTISTVFYKKWQPTYTVCRLSRGALHTLRSQSLMVTQAIYTHNIFTRVGWLIGKYELKCVSWNALYCAMTAHLMIAVVWKFVWGKLNQILSQISMFDWKSVLKLRAGAVFHCNYQKKLSWAAKIELRKHCSTQNNHILVVPSTVMDIIDSW